MADLITVDADSKKEAFEEARKKAFTDGNKIVPAVPISAKPHPTRRGKYIVRVRRSKRYS